VASNHFGHLADFACNQNGHNSVVWVILNQTTSSDQIGRLILSVLRLKSVVHFDPLISSVALCAQKAGQGVCRQRSPATGFKKPATSSCPALILFLFFSLISLLLSLSEKKKAL
jgi:hypothetical protein